MYITLSKDAYDKLSCEASKLLSFESCVEKEQIINLSYIQRQEEFDNASLK